jgi:hypothetical protein
MRKILIAIGLFVCVSSFSQQYGKWAIFSDSVRVGGEMLLTPTELEFPDGTSISTAKVDSSEYSDNSAYADTADYSTNSGQSVYSDTSTYSLAAPSDSIYNLDKEEWLTSGDTIQQSDSVELKKSHTLTVAKSGGMFTTIADAVDSIKSATTDSLNRWTVLIYPGIYMEQNPIDIPNYTSIKSVGLIGTVGIEPLNSGAVFTFDTLSVVDGLSILKADLAFLLDKPGNNQITNCIISGGDTAIKISNRYQLAYIDNIYLVSEGVTLKEGIRLEAGRLAISRVNVVNNDAVNTVFSITGSSSFATISNCNTASFNVDTVLVARDSARVIVSSYSIIGAKNGLVAYTYSNVKFNGDSHLQISGSYTIDDPTSNLGGYANNDDNDEALIIEGQELHVGDAAKGFEVCLGKGDSYSDDISVWTYDGSTYEDYSDSVKRVDGFGIEFPNVNTNTAIYIASTVNDTIKHDGIKIAIVDSMTLGSGEVVLEYWNGSTWVEENAMVSESGAPYAPHAKNYFEQSVDVHIRYNIVLTNDSWGVSDDMSAGTDRKYIRFRIASPITESFRIDQIKLHPDRWEANEDGFTELFGNARNSQILELGIGTGKPFEGSMQNQTIYVDEDIGVGFQTNRFTATGDKLGFPLNFPDNIDTGCPVTFVWSGRPTNSASITWTVRWVVLTPDGILYTSEPAASGNAHSTTTTKTTVEGNNELFSVQLDVSTAIPTRQVGFGDQLWISLQPSTLSGSFDLTNVGAAYWTWAEGGHY